MLKLFNSYSQQKEPFEPVEPESKLARIYVCGVTPYDTSHMGHALVGVFFDTLHRYLQFLGFEVKHVQNLTDVDDDIFKKAWRDKVDYRELGQKWNEIYLNSLKAINILPFDEYVSASSEVESISLMVQKLVEKGFAYPAEDGNVYFRAASFSNYGQLAHLGEAEMMEKARAAAVDSLADEPGNPAKESDLDFIIWQKAALNEPCWDSPFGKGRPGWHIECSAISLNHLGEQFEIHGGGADLLFPHHSSEIAQSESFTGVAPFVKYWMHVGMVYLDGEKMSKSLGNLVLVRDALKNFSPDALRLYLLSTHYRTPLHYASAGISAAEEKVSLLGEALEGFHHENNRTTEVDFSRLGVTFFEALDDDFDTPKAIEALTTLAKAVQKGRQEGKNIAGAQAALKQQAGILGLFLAQQT